MFKIGSSLSNGEKIKILIEKGLYTTKKPRKARAPKALVPMSAAVANIVEPMMKKVIPVTNSLSRKRKEPDSDEADDDISVKEVVFSSFKNKRKKSVVNIKRKASVLSESEASESESSESEASVEYERETAVSSNSNYEEFQNRNDYDDSFYDDSYWKISEVAVSSSSTSTSNAVVANEPLLLFEVDEKVRNKYGLTGTINANHHDGTYDIKCKSTCLAIYFYYNCVKYL
jgi:hypothetical protein